MEDTSEHLQSSQNIMIRTPKHSSFKDD
uniref:Uncharacterized protein n=1 Tax=Anguilla anguilla TaxID=7936 RepID=A0A0E9RAY5_ANGAN